MPEFFSYVEFKERKYFRKDKSDKHGVDLNTDDGRRGDANVLHGDAWRMQQSGNALLLEHIGSGCRYACPWSDVKLALFPKELAAVKSEGKKVG